MLTESARHSTAVQLMIVRGWPALMPIAVGIAVGGTRVVLP